MRLRELNQASVGDVSKHPESPSCGLLKISLVVIWIQGPYEEGTRGAVYKLLSCFQGHMFSFHDSSGDRISNSLK